MGSKDIKGQGTKVSPVDFVEIPENLATIFDSLEPAVKEVIWTDVAEALMLKYWPIKKHAQVAKELGVCTDTALKHYRELTE